MCCCSTDLDSLAAPGIEEATMDALALEKAAPWDLAARPCGGKEIVPAYLRQTRPLYDLYFRPNMWAGNLRRLRRSDPDLFVR